MMNPPGCIADNKMRSRVWEVLLLEGRAPPPLGPVSPKAMGAEDARVLDADVKRTR
jgi:hypothetical protein